MVPVKWLVAGVGTPVRGFEAPARAKKRPCAPSRRRRASASAYPCQRQTQGTRLGDSDFSNLRPDVRPFNPPSEIFAAAVVSVENREVVDLPKDTDVEELLVVFHGLNAQPVSREWEPAGVGRGIVWNALAVPRSRAVVTFSPGWGMVTKSTK